MDRSDLSAMMDPSLTGSGTPPYPDLQPPQEAVDEVLRNKRKAREHKACYPCRQRKVKCDLSRPCQTCKDRDHPELCTYQPPNKRHNAGQGVSGNARMEEFATNGTPFVTLARSEFDFLCGKLHALESSIADLRHELGLSRSHHEEHVGNGYLQPGASNTETSTEPRTRRPTHTDIHGVHVKNDAGEVVHLGAGSIPAMLYALQMNQGHAKQHQIQEMLGKTVLPLFCLDNQTATYPFVDLWGLPHGSLARALELAKALPSDAQMLNLFRCYRDLGYVIYAGIVSPEQLEEDLELFLKTRNAQQGTAAGVTEQQIYGRSFNWLSLLFAVLASGAQCSSMPRKERELTSQVYICCSFECLRFCNFMSQSTNESLQSLCVIGNVMTNNLNAGISWSLLGLTIRLAQGLGVHRACPPNIAKDVVFPRSKIWWAIIWQDSLLSITYDRASATGALDVSTMPPPGEFGIVGAYHSVMYRVSKVSLDIVRDRARPMSTREQLARIHEHQDALSKILGESAPFLRDSRQCKTSRETLEHWGLYLHSSYAMSELLRPAISPEADPELAKTFKQTCIESLVNTVEAFLGLNNITPFARQSWAALHRALGSALLLGILGEHISNDRARKLLTRFINIMADITNVVDAQEIAAPIQRGLTALSKLGIHEAEISRHVSNGTHDRISVAEDGSLKIENSMVTPTSNQEEVSELSPYSVLNCILWGNDQGYPS